MKILVVGGNGYFGSNVAAALRGLPNTTVHIASRNPDATEGEIKLNLNDPATFDVMQGHDFVVNCSDALTARPDPAMAYCLSHGLTFIETTDDAQTMLRLLQKYRGGADSGAATGRLVLGLGIMPGLSNLAAAELVRSKGGAQHVQRIEVALRLNPLSGAGYGMSALSAQVVSTLSKRFENGALISDPPVWFSPLIPFADGAMPALRTGLPEAVMLHYSTGVPNTAAYLSLGTPLPGLGRALETALFGVAMALPRDPFFKPLAQRALSQVFVGVRTVLFREGKTPFEIVAMADRTDYFKHDGDSLSLQFSDGIAAGAYAVAAGVVLLAAQSPAPGVHLPDEVLNLDDVLAKMRTMVGERLKITVRRTEVKQSV
jgi:short subunit dehydrogenase-like uncharacterized protein